MSFEKQVNDYYKCAGKNPANEYTMTVSKRPTFPTKTPLYYEGVIVSYGWTLSMLSPRRIELIEELFRQFYTTKIKKI